jgi:exodeoxyribonuclease VII large subunit
MLFTPPPSQVISVSALNRLARDLLETGVPAVWISGEISNLTLAASGHAYFSLKDASAQVRCVMFRQRLAQLPLRLSAGMQVELKGTVTLYEARGEFQITVDGLRAAGLGRLFEAFERLKAQLAAEGLFEAGRKRPIPGFPRAIGIVTSPAAAALRDVVTTLNRRMPGLPLILYPTPVQGEGAAQQIAQAIGQAARRNEVDVLIVCRGGGSMEDLWSFNEEIVARALAACPIPLISGVGHETDFTICDFVADLRAPTPTAAAEMASPAKAELQQGLNHAQKALVRALTRQLNNKTQQLDQWARRLRHPGERLARQQQQLQHAQTRLQQSQHNYLAQLRLKLERLQSRLQRQKPELRAPGLQLAQHAQALQRAIAQSLREQRQRVQRLSAALEALNPQAILERGYAIVHNSQGVAVTSVQQLAEHERVTLRLAQGSTEARIEHSVGLQPKLPF